MNDETKVEETGAETAETGAATEAKSRRVLIGRVVSDRMQKTITVLVERRIPHPIYRKYIRRSTKLHAHDENDEGRIGDTVAITECRPLSKTKSWKLDHVVERAR